MSRRARYDRITVGYFVLAHLCLVTALLLLVGFSGSFGGFFYHPRMIAVVHLVTLGWITSSILGALYAVLPMAFRVPMAVSKVDRWAFWIYAIGVSGMVAHFWIEERSGMLMSAAMVLYGLIVVGVRSLRSLAKATVPRPISLHFQLAFINLAAAATLGVLAGLNRMIPVLPVFQLDSVYAHAHLAGLGWATLLAMGVAYRLLPMFLPSALPAGSRIALGALMIETGLVLLVVGLLVLPEWIAISIVPIGIGVLSFLVSVVWMLRNRRPAATSLPRLDFGRLLILQAVVWLLVALCAGASLAWGPIGEWKLRLAPVYAVAALMGFLAQLTHGVSLRLVPILGWFLAFDDQPPAVAPTVFASQKLAGLVWLGWSVGVPMLCFALWEESAAWIQSAGAVLLVAEAAALGHLVVTLRRAAQAPRVEAA